MDILNECGKCTTPVPTDGWWRVNIGCLGTKLLPSAGTASALDHWADSTPLHWHVKLLFQADHRHDPFSHTLLTLLSQTLLNVTNAYIQVSMGHMVSLDIRLTQFRNLQNQILIKYDLDYFSTVTTRNVEDSQGGSLGFYPCVRLYQVFKSSLWFYYGC